MSFEGINIAYDYGFQAMKGNVFLGLIELDTLFAAA